MSQTSQKMPPSYPSKQSSTSKKIQKSFKEIAVYNKYSIKLRKIWENTHVRESRFSSSQYIWYTVICTGI